MRAVPNANEQRVRGGDISLSVAVFFPTAPTARRIDFATHQSVQLRPTASLGLTEVGQAVE